MTMQQDSPPLLAVDAAIAEPVEHVPLVNTEANDATESQQALSTSKTWRVGAAALMLFGVVSMAVVAVTTGKTSMQQADVVNATQEYIKCLVCYPATVTVGGRGAACAPDGRNWMICPASRKYWSSKVNGCVSSCFGPSPAPSNYHNTDKRCISCYPPMLVVGGKSVACAPDSRNWMVCPRNRPFWSGKTRGCVGNCWGPLPSSPRRRTSPSSPRRRSSPSSPRRRRSSPFSPSSCTKAVTLTKGKCSSWSSGVCKSKCKGKCVGSFSKGYKCECVPPACFDKRSGTCKSAHVPAPNPGHTGTCTTLVPMAKKDKHCSRFSNGVCKTKFKGTCQGGFISGYKCKCPRGSCYKTFPAGCSHPNGR